MQASKSCDILIGNDDEFGILSNNYEKGLQTAQDLSKEVSIVIYKKGERGSITFIENKEITKGIYPVKALKPTGAGDAFNGALAVALAKDSSYKDAINYRYQQLLIMKQKISIELCLYLMKLDDFLKINKMNN